MKRIYMDRFIDTIEWVAAAFVGIVAANIFIAVLLRNLFAYSIPILRHRPADARHPSFSGYRRHVLSRDTHHRRSSGAMSARVISA
jgi:hypothetical protein